MARTIEYTTPLEGTPCYVNSGIIKAVDRNGSSYPVSEIRYERFDDQNFQYVFTPFWNLIEFLPADIFSGIPGIGLERKQPEYYRVNITPAFVEMRSPSEGREDLWELLESVNLDYYDRFEWMLRSGMRCGDDNLISVRKRDAKEFNVSAQTVNMNELLPGDKVIIDELLDVSESGIQPEYNMERLLFSGAEIYIRNQNRKLSEEEAHGMRYLLSQLIKHSEAPEKINRAAGIKRAGAEGKYAGRKRIPVDPILLRKTVAKFRSGDITEEEAIKILGIGSRSTFYRRMREVEQ